MRAFTSQKGPGKGLPASGFAPERRESPEFPRAPRSSQPLPSAPALGFNSTLTPPYLSHVNRANKNGTTPLAIAKQQGHSAVVALLEEHLDLRFPLHAALSNGDVEAMTQLLDGGAEVAAKRDGATPLLVACEHGHVDAARLVLDKGAEVDRAAIGRASCRERV